jgi:hypothetical protein
MQGVYITIHYDTVRHDACLLYTPFSFNYSLKRTHVSEVPRLPYVSTVGLTLFSN